MPVGDVAAPAVVSALGRSPRVEPRTAPFPWFGGKRRAVDLIWQRLGDVDCYVEPFCGSAAVLLARPDARGVETVSDADHFLCNLWRAVRAEPDAVAGWADYPVIEADLQAWHYWLVTEGAARIRRCEGDPEHYDAQVAGWWLWGACGWIGSGWCSGAGPWSWDGEAWVGTAGQGINRQLPHVGDAGQGINRKLPHVGDAGRGRTEFIRTWLGDLSARLRHVRVACGDWSRVLGDSVTWRHGTCGVLLDPPYGADRANTYAHDCRDVAAQAATWARNAGQRPDMRIAFAGYAGEHDFPGWAAVPWKAPGGYGSQGQGRGRDNCALETLWFSPACIQPEPAVRDLFAGLA